MREGGVRMYVYPANHAELITLCSKDLSEARVHNARASTHAFTYTRTRTRTHTRWQTRATNTHTHTHTLTLTLTLIHTHTHTHTHIHRPFDMHAPCKAETDAFSSPTLAAVRVST